MIFTFNKVRASKLVHLGISQVCSSRSTNVPNLIQNDTGATSNSRGVPCVIIMTIMYAFGLAHEKSTWGQRCTPLSEDLEQAKRRLNHLVLQY